MAIKQLTPVLIVDRVEPCLDFWVDRFGFARQNEVPGDGGALVFASVERDGIEVMYQTRASVVADSPATAADLNGHSMVLFLVVDDFDTTEKALSGVPVVKPRHRTFYGSTEMYVRAGTGRPHGRLRPDGVRMPRRGPETPGDRSPRELVSAAQSDAHWPLDPSVRILPGVGSVMTH
ncbi:MAG: VOC family protein [Gemmatimonadales bacterium]